MIFLSIFADVFIWRHRNNARFIIYFELLYMILHGLAPFNYGSMRNLFQMFTLYLLYLSYCVDMLTNMISLIIFYLVIKLLQWPLLYNAEVTPQYML